MLFWPPFYCLLVAVALTVTFRQNTLYFTDIELKIKFSFILSNLAIIEQTTYSLTVFSHVCSKYYFNSSTFSWL
jgi:hypothetical protein